MTGRQRTWACGLVLAAGILLLILGIARGEVGTVFLKATNICLECIGIG